MGITQTSVFNKTGDNFMVIRKENSIGIPDANPSRMITINGQQTLSQSLNGNVVQIQRIKLVPVNDMAAGILSDTSRLGSSPRGGLMSRPGQTSYRGSTNAI